MGQTYARIFRGTAWTSMPYSKNVDDIINTYYKPGYDDTSGTANKGCLGWELLNDGLDGFGSYKANITSDTYASSDGGEIHSVQTGITTRTMKFAFRGGIKSNGKTVTKAESRNFVAEQLAGSPSVTVVIEYDGGGMRKFGGIVSAVSLFEGNIYEPMTLTVSIASSTPDMYVGSHSTDMTSVSATSTINTVRYDYGVGNVRLSRTRRIRVKLSATGIAAFSKSGSSDKIIISGLQRFGSLSGEALAPSATITADMLQFAGLTASSKQFYTEIRCTDNLEDRSYKAYGGASETPNMVLRCYGLWQIIQVEPRRYEAVTVGAPQGYVSELHLEVDELSRSV